MAPKRGDKPSKVKKTLSLSKPGSQKPFRREDTNTYHLSNKNMAFANDALGGALHVKNAAFAIYVILSKRWKKSLNIIISRK